MLNVDFTFLWILVNLIILYFFLRKFLFGRVGKYMDDRAAAIAADIERAEKAREDAAAVQAKYEGLMARAEEQSQAILDEARQKAKTEYSDILTDARKNASIIIAEAHSRANAEHDKAMAQVREEVASLALSAASKVMAANMDEQKNRDIVDKFLAEEGVA